LNSKLFIFFLLSVIILGCSPEGPVGHTYHNVTAHYNGYFYAKERIKEIKNDIESKYSWDYTRILPIFPQYDTTVAKSYAEKAEDCIKKASIAIQQHPGSRWEYDAYIQVGLARMYSCEFPEAIETFKYVNTRSKSSDERHLALIHLLRTFTEAVEYNNAIAVSDFLEKEELSTNNKQKLFLNRAYLYQKLEDYNKMVINLTSAEELLPNNKENARIDFIIGQVYQQLGFDANAYDYYRSALKRSPTYELSFYSKLNLAQVTQMTKNTSVKRIQKYFKKLLKDPKNLEYQDRIYYEMGDFELKRGNIDKAIENYISSTQVESKNNRQKAYSFLKLGTIYYDTLKNFPKASSYYDSAVSVLPKKEAIYPEVKQRQEVLAEFVKYYVTVQVNDSLLALNNLSPDSLSSLLDSKVAELKFQDEERKRKEAEAKKKKSIVSTTSSFNSSDPFSNGPSINSELSGVWYFYNQAELSRGINEFREKWGQRELEDNWRRSQRSDISADDTSIAETEEQEAESKEDSEEEVEDIFDEEAARQELMASIPSDTGSINKLNNEIEEAFYFLGNIYNFKLEERENSIITFNKLLDRYPGSEYEPEVLYQLYLLMKEEDTVKSIPYSSQLLKDYPESIYTKLIFNPNFREENQALNLAYKKIYERAYKYYEIDSTTWAINLIDSALLANEETEYHDNLSLLKAMVVGKTDGIYKYQFELNKFIDTYPESEVVTYAKRLVKASEDYQINLYSSSRARFVKYLNDKHYFMLVYKTGSNNGKTYTLLADSVITENSLNVRSGNLVLDQENALILVTEFSGKPEAEAFLSLYKEKINGNEKLTDNEIHLMVITKDNFDILYETKDLESYLSFFKENYL